MPLRFQDNHTFILHFQPQSCKRINFCHCEPPSPSCGMLSQLPQDPRTCQVMKYKAPEEKTSQHLNECLNWVLNTEDTQQPPYLGCSHCPARSCLVPSGRPASIDAGTPQLPCDVHAHPTHWPCTCCSRYSSLGLVVTTGQGMCQPLPARGSACSNSCPQSPTGLGLEEASPAPKGLGCAHVPLTPHTPQQAGGSVSRDTTKALLLQGSLGTHLQTPPHSPRPGWLPSWEQRMSLRQTRQPASDVPYLPALPGPLETSLPQA